MRGWKTVMPGGGPNGVGLMVHALLARLDAAEQAAITYSADISNLESARDAALARVAELERLLRDLIRDANASGTIKKWDRTLEAAARALEGRTC